MRILSIHSTKPAPVLAAAFGFLLALGSGASASASSNSEFILRVRVNTRPCGSEVTAKIWMDNNSSRKVIGFSYGVRHDPAEFTIQEARLGKDVDLESRGALSCVTLSDGGLTHQVTSCPIVPAGRDREILVITYRHIGSPGTKKIEFAEDLPGPFVSLAQQLEVSIEGFCAGDPAPVPIRFVVEDPAKGPVTVVPRTLADALDLTCPDIDVNPAAVDFGDVFVEDSRTRLVTIANAGNESLSIRDIRLVEDDATAEFGLDPQFMGKITLAPKGKIVAAVSYSPNDLLADSGAIIIESNDPDEGLLMVPLSGNGAARPAPEIEVDPESLDFGETFLGDTRTLSLTITNAGSAPLTVSDIALASGGEGGDFAIVECHLLPIVLVPRASAPVKISYRTLDEGPDADAVVIASDDADESTVTVPLSGSGAAKPLAEIDATPRFHNYGSVALIGQDCGEGAARVTVTVANTGSAGLLLMKISLAEGGSADFALEPGLAARLPVIVPAKESFEFEASYCPRDEGSDSGVILIESDDRDESITAVSLFGNGALPAAPEIEVIPRSLMIDFLGVAAGSSSTFPITILNRGTAALVGAVRAGSENSPDFALPELEFDLAPGEEISIPVQYAPGEEGSDSGTAVIESNDADEPSLVVSFIGSGIIPVTADAGDDQALPEESVVELDGSRSTGPSGLDLVFRWEQIAGSAAEIIAGQDSERLSIRLPAIDGGDQDLVFRLTVSDGAEPPEADDDTVTIRGLDADERRASVALRSDQVLEFAGGRRKIAFDGEISWLTELEDGLWSGLAFRIEDDAAIEDLTAATLYRDANDNGEVDEGDAALASITELDPERSRLVFAFEQILSADRPERFLLVVDVRPEDAIEEIQEAGLLLAAILLLAAGLGAAVAGRKRLAPTLGLLLFLLLASVPLACHVDHKHRRRPGLEPANEVLFILEAQEGTVFLEGASSRINVPASRISGLPIAGPVVMVP